MGLFANSRRPAKNDPDGRVLELTLPLPRSPKKKLSTTYPKHLPIKTPPTNVLAPGQIPWETPMHESTTMDTHTHTHTHRHTQTDRHVYVYGHINTCMVSQVPTPYKFLPDILSDIQTSVTSVGESSLSSSSMMCPCSSEETSEVSPVLPP